jgi:alpha-tubulin suppressor-like RCC1 family protein
VGNRPTVGVNDMGVNWRKKSVVAFKIGLCTMMIGWGIVTDGPKKMASAAVGNSAVPALAASASHSMSLSSDGTFRVWGNNEDKQLGIAGPVSSMRIPKLMNMGEVSFITTGVFHSAIVKTNGELWVLGRNDAGQLGLTPSSSDSLPMRVEGIGGVKSAAAGLEYTLALKGNGEVWEMGHNQFDFTAGRTSSTHLQLVPGLPADVDTVAAGFYSSFAIADGNLYAWGLNLGGQLGDGTNTNRQFPITVPISGVKAVGASGHHAVALKEDGTVWAWGSNSCGQLGNGTITSSKLPIQVPGLSGITSIAVGFYHNLALGSDGRVHAWGCYPLGLDSEKVAPNSPASLVPLNDVIAIAAGNVHSLAMTSDGTVWGWGLST